MNPIQIFFSSDENYTQHLAVSIASILLNCGDDDEFNFYILDGGITTASKAKINTLKKIKPFEIEYLSVKEEDFKFCTITKRCKYVSIATYYRFKIASLKPELEKAIYLDCDITAKTSLKELWETDISDFVLGAVEESAIPNLKLEALERLSCNYYFNAGVLLINLKKWREISAEKKCFDFVEHEKEKILWVDQDVLNCLFKDDVKFLHPRWNLQTSALRGGKYTIYGKEEVDSAMKTPSIIHFNTHVKPWYPKKKHSFEKEYFRYLKYTDWKNFIHQYRLLVVQNIFSKIKKFFIH